VNIERALTGGDPRRLQNVDEVVGFVLAHPGRVKDLFECVFQADEIVRMRASDALEKVCARRPDLLQPFAERLLTDVAAIDQPSVQWHLAQMLAAIELTPAQLDRAVAVLERNLDRYEDWIVVNLTLQSLAEFVRRQDELRSRFLARLRTYEDTAYKSVASRVRKLLAEFQD
jgi:hypothetical protein